MSTSENQPDHAGVLFPPPFIFLGFLMAGVLGEVLLPTFIFEPGWGRFIFGVPLFLAGASLIIWAVQLFNAHKTGIPPWSKSKAIVNVGPYRRTRNPMYIGMTLMYAGLAMLFASLYALLLLPVVLVIINTYVIAREEAYLTRKFGPDYLAYCQQVRRWL